MIRQEPKPPPSMRPYERLAMRIIEVAIHDARFHKKSTVQFSIDAREWLCKSPLCKLICESLDLDQSILIQWVRIGCPGEKKARGTGNRWLIMKDT